MTQRGEGRAFGKAILFGEHVVVYGVPAIAVGLERGARAVSSAVTSDVSTLHIEGPGFAAKVRDDEVIESISRMPLGANGLPERPRDLVARAFRAITTAVRDEAKEIGNVHVHAVAELPAGGGLGCSAALGVAIARALDPAAGNSTIQVRASAWEKVFHGTPSGVDAAVSTEGGCVHFEKTATNAKVMPITVKPPGLLLAIGNTGISSSTRTMVEGVAQLRERRRDAVEKTFEGVRALVGNARLAIEAGDIVGLGKLMDLNQMLLSGLMVSTPEIEQMCALAREAGALGAKLTGGGGGGAVIALVSDEAAASRVLAAWREHGFDGFSSRVGMHA